MKCTWKLLASLALGEARRFAKLADEHARSLAGIESKSPLASGTAAHSRHFASLYRQRAQKALQLAQLHEGLAPRAD